MNEMENYMDRMDQELAPTTMGKSFAKSYGKFYLIKYSCEANRVKLHR